MTDTRHSTPDTRHPTGLTSIDLVAVAACRAESARRRAWYHQVARPNWLAGNDAPKLRSLTL